MRAAIDFAASSAAADSCCGCHASKQVAVALAVADRFAEVQRGPGRPGGPDRDQGDLVVDLDDRLGEHPVVRHPARGHRALPGRLDIVDAQQHRLALTGHPRDRLDHQREAGVLGHRGQLLDRTGEPERRGRQAELVGGQPPHALPVLAHPHAAGSRIHLEAAFGGGDQRIDRDDAGFGDHVAAGWPVR